MKILYVCDKRIDVAINAVKKRYTSVEVEVARTLSDVSYIINRGDTIDRIIVFDNILNKICDMGDTKSLRLAIQSLVEPMKVESTTEIVCVACSNITGMLFLEELFEIDYKSAVYVVGKQLNTTEIVNYSLKSIAQLRAEAKKIIATDMYQNVDDVIWSDTKSTTSDWEQLESRKTINEIVDKFRLNIALEILDFIALTALWEYKTDFEIPNEPVNASKQVLATVNKKPSLFSRILEALKKLLKRA